LGAEARSVSGDSTHPIGISSKLVWFTPSPTHRSARAEALGLWVTRGRLVFDELTVDQLIGSIEVSVVKQPLERAE